MGWSAPPRPDWVAAINRGEFPPIEQEARLPFQRDALLAEARARFGLVDGGPGDFGAEDFPADEMTEGLDSLLPALEEEARLTTLGRWMARRFLLRVLEVRMQLMQQLRADPAVREEPIRRPLFVAGAPRTGTTFLFDLLSADPGLRAPLGWELLRPLPPTDPERAERESDARIGLAERELVLPQTVESGLLPIHVYGARRPKECVSAMSYSFRSEEFTGRWRVPSYEAWLDRADLEPAYRMHRLVLQCLQRGAEGQRRGRPWVLKSPVHLHALPTLLRTYPDAQIAITHRDPLVVLASLTSLIATLRHAHSDEVDYTALARTHAQRYERSFAKLVEWSDAGALPEEQAHHCLHADLLEAPLGVVDDLCARFGRRLDGEAREKIEAAAAARPRGEHGAHAYDFEALGLDRDSTRAAFAGYRRRFGVPEE